MSFPAYPSYRDSGVEWLGALPRHWRVERLGNLYRDVSEAGSAELPVLSVSIHTGVSDEEASSDDSERKIVRSEDRSKYKRVSPNDLTYNMMRAWQGGFGTVQVEGMVSPAYVVARPRGDIPSRYIELLLRTPGAVEEMRRHSRGVTDFRLRLYWDQFKDIRVALPPQEEWNAILAFVDRESIKIDALVEEQRRLIELLKEKRRAIISQAVTKGLDRTVPMRDSGVKWLGEVPAHWEVKKLGWIGEAITGLTYSPEDIVELGAGTLVLRSSNVQQGNIVLNDNVYVATPISHKLRVRSGDILICSRNGSRELIGKNATIDGRSAGSTFGAFMTVFRTTSHEFVQWALNSSIFKAQAGEFLTATINQLTLGNLNGMEIPLPPSDEQSAIALCLARETSRIDALATQAQSAATLLAERRASLISAAVTGKIDVRGAVSRETVAA